MHSVSQSCFRGKNLIAYCINFFVLLLTHICEILYLWHWSVKCLHFDPYQYVLKKKLHYLQKLLFLCLLSLSLLLRSSGNFNFRFTRDLSQEFSASFCLHAAWGYAVVLGIDTIVPIFSVSKAWSKWAHTVRSRQTTMSERIVVTGD